MHFQLINIASPIVFKKYSHKYNIYRNLYEICSFGLELRGLTSENADIIHQIFLKNGDFSYLNSLNANEKDLLALGTLNKLKESANLIKSNVNEEIGHRINQLLRNYEHYDEKNIKINGKTFYSKNVHVIGILNVTPDSFSDGGKFKNIKSAVNFASKMINIGVDIIDIGGESSRPGASFISEKEELDRVIPVISEILNQNPEVIISIDTTKSAVADAALKSGASMINDISGLTLDPEMVNIASKYNSALVIMHMKGIPATMQNKITYDDLLTEVYDFLYNQVSLARKNNIENILIDPGFGFGKSLQDNYELLSRLNELKGIGCPILSGLSRKSMLGKPLNLDINNRDFATVAADTIAINNGSRYIRTHNIENAVQIKKLFQFMNNPEILVNG